MLTIRRTPFTRVILLLLALGVRPASAQSGPVDSLLFTTPVQIAPEQKGEVRLEVDNLTFVRDNEYKGKLVKGYTLPGIWIEPSISFQPLKNLKVEAGFHLLHYWGANRYPSLNYTDMATWKGNQTQKGFHCVPTFRAHMQLSPQVDVVLGTLYGRQNHRLSDPLYNDEHALSSDPEAGLQVLWHTRPFSLDAWINWESFIFRNDSHQESFTFGLSTRFRPSRRRARVQTYVPLQVLFQHRGGEINAEASDRAIKTWLNAAAGVGVDIPLRTRIPVRLNAEANLALYRQQAGNALPFDSGWGVQAKATAQVWRFSVSAGYWHCHDFISIFGNPLYGTLGIDDRQTTYTDPTTLTFTAEYAQPLGKGFAWGIRSSAFATLPADVLTPGQNSGLESMRPERSSTAVSLGVGIFLRIRPSFLLKKL